jgi:hypothetical protein
MIELLLYYGESLYDAVTYPAVIIEKDTNGDWEPDDCPSSMILALDQGHDDVVKYIINEGFDVYSRHSMGRTFSTEHSIWAKWKSSKCYLRLLPHRLTILRFQMTAYQSSSRY